MDQSKTYAQATNGILYSAPICMTRFTGNEPLEVSVNGRPVEFEKGSGHLPYSIFVIDEANSCDITGNTDAEASSPKSPVGCQSESPACISLSTTCNNDIYIDTKNLTDGCIVYKQFANSIMEGQIAVCRCDPFKRTEGFHENIVKIGHRGARSSESTFKENTVLSFIEAYELGADAVELDVHFTADSVLVVYHDNEIAGVEIPKMTYKEFLTKTGNVDGHPGYPDTLRKVLDKLPGNLGVNIEIKNATNEELLSSSTDYLAKLVSATLAIVREYHSKNILFSSFSPLVCIYARMLSSTSQVCLLVGKDSYSRVGSSSHEVNGMLSRFVEYANLDGFVFDTAIVDDVLPLLPDIKNRKKSYYCYGDALLRPEEVKKLKTLGFSGFITDSLEVLTQSLGQ